MIVVFILINCVGGSEKQVTFNLQKLPIEICNTFGIFDFVCKIHGNDIESIEKTVQNIRKIKHITSTNSIHTIPEQE